MEERKKYLHGAWFTASYFYPKREKKEQNPLASSNTRRPELQLWMEISKPLSPTMSSLFKVSQEIVHLSKKEEIQTHWKVLAISIPTYPHRLPEKY